MKNFIAFFSLIIIFLFAVEQVYSQGLPGFSTDFENRSIELDELIDGGPGKDGIPSIDKPKFVSQKEAEDWVRGQEPVIALEINGEARAYPIQILMWHEIVNDELGGVPVSVTFCPLCYSAIVFDRRIDGETHDFGVSGLLRHSDMIMFDRKTESLWQQFSGEALVGEYTGEFLTIVPSQLISFEQFQNAYPDAPVLSRNTGHQRNYGENPYAGYDDINKRPFLMDEADLSDKLPPMEKIIGVRLENEQIGYRYSITSEKKVLNDTVSDNPFVIFHLDGMASALDNRAIHQSRDDGATGVFSRILNGKTLDFIYENGTVKDRQTNSEWNITGRAVSGPMEGEQLETMTYGDYFAFAWMVFYPNTKIFE